MPRLQDVFGLYTKMLLGLGLVFQLPTIVFFLAKMKLVTARFLAVEHQVRDPHHLRHGGRHHARRRHDGAGDRCGADARPLPLSILIAWVVNPRSRSKAVSRLRVCNNRCKWLIDFKYQLGRTDELALFMTLLLPREVTA